MRPMLLVFALLGLLPFHGATACELRLLLSWDVSASMSDRDYTLQRDGTAAAFRDPAILNAIAISPGGILVSVIQWAGTDEQAVVVPWINLRSSRDAHRLARTIELATDPYDTRNGTAIGNSLRWSAAHLAASPQPCNRTVLDISGDGPSNIGIPTRPEAERLAAAGVSINGLVIPGFEKLSGADPYMFYVDHVSVGPSSFVVDVAGYEDYARAIRKKLLRELTPFFAQK